MPKAVKAQPKELNVIPCKYAYDESDPYCKDCNGMQIDVDGALVPATECGGYSPIEETVNDVVDEVVNDETVVSTPISDPPVNEDPKANTTKPAKGNDAPKPDLTAKTTFNEKMPEKQPKPKKIIPAKEILEKDDVQEVVLTPPQNIDTQSKTVEINCESGLTIEIKDRYGNSRWYKVGYSEKQLISIYDDVEEARRLLWQTVNREVDNQIDDILQSLQNT